MLNRDHQKIATKIHEQFKSNFNISRLYQYCYRIYKDQSCLTKYSNFMSYLHLINTRVLQSSKEDKFIVHWFCKICKNKDYNPSKNDIQELFIVLELLEGKKKQIYLFIKFLKEITSEEWGSLEKRLLLKIIKFRDKIQAILRILLLKEKPTLKKQLQKRFEAILQTQESNGQIDQQNQQIDQTYINNNEKKDYRTSIFMNQTTNSDFSICPYTASSIKLSQKAKPSIIKLLSQQQVEQIRKSFMQKNRATITTNESIKQPSQIKSKIRNFLTLHTDVSENKNKRFEYIAEEDATPNFIASNSELKSKSPQKKSNRQHKSVFQSLNKMTRLFGFNGKSQQSFNQKKQNYNNKDKNKNKNKSKISILRNTIEQHSMNRLKSQNLLTDNYKQKSNINQMNTNNKLDKEKYRSKKQVMSKLKDKKKRGGMIMSKQQLKQDQQIDQSEEDQIQSDTVSENSSFTPNIAQQESSNQSSEIDIKTIVPKIQKQNKNDEDEDEAMSIKILKDNKVSRFKRRIGISPKIKQFKSIDYSLPIQELLVRKKKTSAFINHASFFRSSGPPASEEKKYITKSKYKQKAQSKIFKFYQDDIHLNDEIDSNLVAVPSSKQINQRNLKLQQRKYEIDRRGVITDAEMTNILSEIHNQHKINRNGSQQNQCITFCMKKEEVQVDYKKCERIKQKDFKIEQIDIINNNYLKPKIKRQSKLFDFMKKNIRQFQKNALVQCSISSNNQQSLL